MPRPRRRRPASPIWPLSPAQWFLVAAAAFLLFSLAAVAMRRVSAPVPDAISQDPLDTWLDDVLARRRPVRAMPERFPARTYLPPHPENVACGTNGCVPFDPARDLVRIEDSRVWWESENDFNDDEDDHVFHRAMETPMRRLIELVSAAGGTLKVQDAYRPEGVHNSRSLHREGRAVDLTCDELGLEQLAKLAWAAGFDWVYHESPKRGGAHIHASVRAEGPSYRVTSR